MKKFLYSFVVLLFSISALSSTFVDIAKAEEEEQENEQNYNQLKSENIIDDSVSEEEWNEYLKEDKTEKENIESEKEITSYAKSSFKLKKGDVLITNGTSSKGLTGHAAIAISSKTVIHISGSGAHPSTKSFASFKKDYGKGKKWVKVYRSKKAGAGTKAGNWAIKNYKGKKYKYGINTKLSKKNPTYCSKIIYQAYKYGASKKSIYDPGSHIISPYALPNISSNAYKLKKIKTF